MNYSLKSLILWTTLFSLTLGLSVVVWKYETFLLLPLLGLLWGALFGAPIGGLSDTKPGRRRPMIIGGAIGFTLALIVIGYAMWLLMTNPFF